MLELATSMISAALFAIGFVDRKRSNFYSAYAPTAARLATAALVGLAALSGALGFIALSLYIVPEKLPDAWYLRGVIGGSLGFTLARLPIGQFSIDGTGEFGSLLNRLGKALQEQLNYAAATNTLDRADQMDPTEIAEAIENRLIRFHIVSDDEREILLSNLKLMVEDANESSESMAFLKERLFYLIEYYEAPIGSGFSFSVPVGLPKSQNWFQRLMRTD